MMFLWFLRGGLIVISDPSSPGAGVAVGLDEKPMGATLCDKGSN